MWLYRERLVHAVAAAGRDEPSRRFLLNLLIAFLPAAIVGFLAHDWIKARLFTPVVVALALVIGGVLILLIERLRPAERVAEVGEVRPPTALGIGLAQVLSLVPNTPALRPDHGRLRAGLRARAATEFSFFVHPGDVGATLLICPEPRR